MSRAYLDHNASSPVRPEVAAAVADALCRAGNPSSVHGEGRTARALVGTAREQVAALVGARPDEVVFTSGGTEANNLALRPGALLDGAGQSVHGLLTAATEHPAVLSGHGFGVDGTVLPVDADGRVEFDTVERALDAAASTGLLLSLQFANSETGVLQPVEAVGELARAHGAALHVDAVQAAGRVPLHFGALGAQALTLSGHKFGAPAGVGALVIDRRRVGPGLRLVSGGGQEGGIRGGTENVAGIVGFGVAAALAARDLDAEASRLRCLRGLAEKEIRRIAPDATVFGAGAERLPNTVAFAVPGLDAQIALMALDLEGVAVSSGSACSSGRVGRSHVLAAMGVPAELAAGAIRLSFGWNSTQEDVMRFAGGFEKLVQRLYRDDRARAA